MDADCEAWRKVWLKFEDVACAPWRGVQLLNCEPLPAITGDCIAKVARTYKERTGLGCDDFHPRWFGWLSPELLSAFAVLLTAIEGIGLWPAQLQGILVPLIPKADGGRRPIGLLAALVRVWERIRKPVVATWRRTVERPYNWAAKGRSPQAAAWHHSLRAEAAVARGLDAASILIDLVKAFELVRLELVWAAGISLGFPPVILRLVLEAFAFARRLVINTALSEATVTLSAILAGGSFATDALFIVLVGPCDALLRAHQPRRALRLFVDDLTIDAVGTEL